MKGSNCKYEADAGGVLVRKADDFVMGIGIDLGASDSIENYYERACTEEELVIYYPPKQHARARGTKKRV